MVFEHNKDSVTRKITPNRVRRFSTTKFTGERGNFLRQEENFPVSKGTKVLSTPVYFVGEKRRNTILE